MPFYNFQGAKQVHELKINYYGRMIRFKLSTIEYN